MPRLPVRRFNPDVVALVANPVLSVQKAAVSSLSQRSWYDDIVLARPGHRSGAKVCGTTIGNSVLKTRAAAEPSVLVTRSL